MFLRERCFSQNCCVKILTLGFSAHPKASRQNPTNRGGLLDEVPQIQIASLRRGFFICKTSIRWRCLIPLTEGISSA
nr:MAG TPA_asm: hypothetical protein [Caudoviricetes sp.]